MNADARFDLISKNFRKKRKQLNREIIGDLVKFMTKA